MYKVYGDIKCFQGKLSSLGVVCILFFLPSLLFAQTFGGGSFDGYDNKSRGLQVGYPSVVNTGATNITDQSAWMNGTLVATGTADTVVYLYWGATDGVTNKWNWTTNVSLGVCPEYQVLTTNATSLASNTTYYYRYYASNTAGSAWANPSTTFETAGPPVLNTGIGAAPVSFDSAILWGNIISGATANVTIYCGANSNNWTYTNNLGTKSQGIVFSTAVTNLSAGTVYYYRCYGTNTYGQGSADTTFTTRANVNAFWGGSYDGYDGIISNSVVIAGWQGVLFLFQ